MDAALNEFSYLLKDNKVWRFRANQTSYFQLEKLSGRPLFKALFPAPVKDPETGEEAPDKKAQLLLLYAMTASHRAQERIQMRFTFDEERDYADNYRGPFFTDILPTGAVNHLLDQAAIAVRADFGFAEQYLDDAIDALDEDDEGNDQDPQSLA